MIREILKSYKNGELNEEQAEEKILKLLYEEGGSKVPTCQVPFKRGNERF